MLDNHLKVSDIQLRKVTGTLDRIGSKQQLEQGTAMSITDSQTLSVREEIGNEVKYDLIGKLVENADGNRVRIFDAVGRQMVTQSSVTDTYHYQVPTSGVYLIQVGDYPARKVTIVK